MAPSLETLPPELQASIAYHADSRDLKSLSLVNHAISARTSGEFIETFFRSRVHTFTRHALRTLVAITKNPQLCRRMRGLQIVFVTLDVSFVEPGGQLEITAQALHRNGSNELLKRYGTDPGADDCGIICCRLEAEYRALKREAYGMVLLSEALFNLQKAGIVPNLALTGRLHEEEGASYESREPYHPAIYGLQAFSRWLGFRAIRPHFVPLPDHDMATRTMLRAVATSGYPAKFLDVIQNLNTPPRPECFSLANIRPSRCASDLWSNLTNLNLSIPSAEKAVLTSADYEPLRELLAAAASVRDLMLDFGNDRYNNAKFDTLQWSLDALTTTSLESVYLCQAFVREQDLLVFLEKQSRTLDHVSLDSCATWSEEAYSNILRWMADNLQLTSFLTQSPYCHTQFDGDGLHSVWIKNYLRLTNHGFYGRRL